jgi:hypothetical protein
MAVVSSGLSQKPGRAIIDSISARRVFLAAKSKILLELLESFLQFVECGVQFCRHGGLLYLKK